MVFSVIALRVISCAHVQIILCMLLKAIWRQALWKEFFNSRYYTMLGFWDGLRILLMLLYILECNSIFLNGAYEIVIWILCLNIDKNSVSSNSMNLWNTQISVKGLTFRLAFYLYTSQRTLIKVLWQFVNHPGFQ